MIEKTKVAAYLIWEITHYDNTLALWRCAESIGQVLAENSICSPLDIEAVLREGPYSEVYVSFVRKIAYRLYIHTDMPEWDNWFNAETLLHNIEWRIAVTGLALKYKYS